MTKPALFPSRTILRDYSMPIRERHSKVCGPYYFDPPDVIEDARSVPEFTGGYLNSTGDRFGRGSFTRLRVDRAANVEGAPRRIKHNGYYTDVTGWGGDPIYGIVALLPRSRGFLAGWTFGGGASASLDRRCVYDTALDAAYAADSLAERAADREREYQQELIEAQERDDAACAAD